MTEPHDPGAGCRAGSRGLHMCPHEARLTGPDELRGCGFGSFHIPRRAAVCGLPLRAGFHHIHE
jgi:hypothetical protein